MSMKIYDLDHLETISDDVTVMGGSEPLLNMGESSALNFNISGGSRLNVNAVSLNLLNTGNTVSSNTGIGANTWPQRLNFVKSLALFTPSAVKGISKAIASVKSILQSRFKGTKITA